MNNEELKKKISQIISEYCCPYGKTHKQLYGDDRMCYSKMNFAECNPITECTDALIAAGIGDVKSLEISDASKEQSSINYYCEMREWKDKCREAEHRAEVAEKALDLCETAYILSLNHRATEGISGQAIASDLGVHNFFMEQAEKELAEENSGKKKI